MIKTLNKKLREINKLEFELKDKKKLNEGFYIVNNISYFLTFKEVDKYNERRFIFQKFNTPQLVQDIKNNSFSNIKNYIDDFKLEVIEDSTYNIQKIKFIF